jgi:ribosome-associated protein
MTRLSLASSLAVCLLLATWLPHSASFTILPSRTQYHFLIFSSSSSSGNPDTDKPILCDLQTFLRLLNLDEIPTGGAAKWIIQDGQVLLNGQVETRRAKKLYAGDKVQLRNDDTMLDVAAQVALRGYVYKPKNKNNIKKAG